MTLGSLLDLMRADPRTFTYAELTSVASKRGVAGALARGDIVRVLTDRYTARLHADSWWVRLNASMTSLDGAVVTGPSALRLFGLQSVTDDAVHVVTPRAIRRRVPDWLRVRRSDLDIPLDSRVTLPTHVPGFALAVGHGMVPPGDRAEFVFGAFREGLVTADEVGAALDRLPRVVGRRILARRALAASQGVHSFLEEAAWGTVLHTALGRSMLRQHRIAVAGRAFRVDAYHPASRTAIEFDGARWHSGDARELDTVRDALLATTGVLVLRLRYSDVMTRPEWCREVVAMTVAARLRGVVED